MITWTAGLRWAINARAWLGYFAPLPGGRALLRYEQTFKYQSPAVAAKAIRAFCDEHKITLGVVTAQPAIFPKPKERGEFPSETFRRGGISVRPGHANRLAGWTRLRSWLDVSGDVDPPASALVIHPDCKVFLRTVPSLVADPLDPDDIVETIEEYPAMGAALWAMSRPAPWTHPEDVLPPDAIGHWVNEIRAAAEAESY
jgi:hypothetical protein